MGAFLIGGLEDFSQLLQMHFTTTLHSVILCDPLHGCKYKSEMQMVATFQTRCYLQLGGLRELPALWWLPTLLFLVQGEERRLQVLDPN